MSSRDPGISIRIDNIPVRAPRTRWLVKKEIAKVLHNRIRFSVNGRPGNFGLDPVPDDDPNPSFLAAILTIPLKDIGHEFLSETLKNPVQLYKQPLRFSLCDDPPRQKDVDKLYKMFYVDPSKEERHATILDKLQALGELHVSEIQFGIFFENHLMGQQRSFSVEWRRKYEEKQASLSIDYDRRRFVVQARKKASSCFYISIPFSSILEIDIGHASFSNIPYICFDTTTPPSFTQEASTSEKRGASAAPRGGKADKNKAKLKHRVGFLDEAHALVAPYAPCLRLQLHRPESALQTFKQMCTEAEVDESFIKHHLHTLVIPAYYDHMFFSETSLETLAALLKGFGWQIAFQLESLIRSGLLHTADLDRLVPLLQDLAMANTLRYAGDLLRTYGEALRHNKHQRRHTRLAYDELIENPVDCFQRVRRTFVRSDLQSDFRCCHVTITPSRMLLEGPYVTQKNRVIRKYSDFQDHFIRVDFRDEDKGRYRSDRDVDGTPLLQSRVGGILNKGFILAGRKFEFLAYSNSSLKEHAVWFVHPFQIQNQDRMINASFIRSSLGRFEGHQLMKTPSKYAARIGQAFTSTLDSVDISKSKWEELAEDLECGSYCFTDGVGTISKAFADEIWAKLCEGRRDPPPAPSAYMIRFLGYKGVVSVDLELPNNAMKMRLRPSMKKFDAEIANMSPVEIVRAFERPNTAYLNRPLIMFLEDRKVPINSFLQLQATAVDRARKISTSIDHFVRLSSSYHLGSNFYLLDLLRRIEKECSPTIQNRIFQLPLFQGLCRVATGIILREIRERARIPIEGSYHLVGVADEGPEYIKHFGWKDVLCLREGEIFVCIRTHADESPIWLQGSATISRNPITHPGDVQRVHAIGKPPDNQRCLFKHLKNVVVMPSQGKRPLASCLAGGDLDGDEFSVIMDETLFPQTDVRPADYLPTAPWTLDGNETVKPKHITKFIVQYIESDVLGLLSDKLLLVADQSPDGVFDKKCIQLAEWCSKAVDYPKQGIPVQLDFRSLPRPLTPDWYIQDVDPTSNTISNANYVCESPRALGCLYREALRLETLEQASATARASQSQSDSRASGTPQHPITPILKSKIGDFLGDAVHASNNRSQSAHIRQLFEHYRIELQYICSMTTLSSLSGTKLSEEEVVLGKILGAGLQKNLRKDLQQRMKDNIASLVRNVRRHLLAENLSPGQDEHPDLFYGLELAWSAWNFSVSKQGEFGSSSFGLIALGTFFHCLDRLD